MAVFVGERDVTDEDLRHTARLDRQQGATRLARAGNWVAAMRAAAEARRLQPRVTFTQVAEVDHSFKRFMRHGELGDRVFEALFGPPGHELQGSAAPGVNSSTRPRGASREAVRETAGAR
jgi:hypothetical protein